METPDRWMLVRVKGETPHWRIFATWSGGYTQGDSWRLNSGVESVEVKDDYYDFHGFSGSLYRCRKTAYGVNMYGMGVLENLLSKSDLLEAVWEEPKDILKEMEMS
jgi:hypothetical protein